MSVYILLSGCSRGLPMTGRCVFAAVSADMYYVEATMETNETLDARVEVARLIRLGHPLIGENPRVFLDWAYTTRRTPEAPVCGCALGAAWVAHTGVVSGDYPFRDHKEAYYVDALEVEIPVLMVRIPKDEVPVGTFIAHCGDPTIAEVVDALHAHSDWTRLHIAGWLEAGKIPADPTHDEAQDVTRV